MSFFMSDALAQTTTSQPQSDGMFSMVMIAAIFVLFYFMIIRPQNKRTKEHREMVNRLKKGDEVITSGGILGKVTHIDEQYVKITIAENTDILAQRSSVTTILPKGTMKSL